MQITPHIHLLPIPFSVPLPTGPVSRSVNAVLLCGESLVLVDSGVAGAQKRIFDYLQSMGRAPEEIETLVLTHSHPDHIGAALALKRAAGCTVAAHGAEREWIEDVALQERERPVPGFNRLVGGPVAVERLLEDRDLLDIRAGVRLQVLHTPGHSPGSISLWSAEEGVLITGDAVPVPGDLPIFDDFRAQIASLERLRGLGARLLLSAWDRPREGGEVGQCIDDALVWLERLRAVASQEASRGREDDPLALCRRVVALLGLPPAAVNPLVARSLAACLA